MTFIYPQLARFGFSHLGVTPSTVFNDPRSHSQRRFTRSAAHAAWRGPIGPGRLAVLIARAKILHFQADVSKVDDLG
jgi:hypothetical protein